MHYSPTSWSSACPARAASSRVGLLYAIEQGFDGVFIAADGEECAYLPDCTERTAGIVADAQELIEENGHEPQRREDGRHLLGLRRAVRQLHAESSRSSLAALGPLEKAAA